MTRSESVRLLLDCILFATRTLQQWTPWLSHNQIHKQRLGHSASSVTENYSIPSRKMSRAAAEKLGDFFGTGWPEIDKGN